MTVQSTISHPTVNTANPTTIKATTWRDRAQATMEYRLAKYAIWKNNCTLTWATV